MLLRNQQTVLEAEWSEPATYPVCDNSCTACTDTGRPRQGLTEMSFLDLASHCTDPAKKLCCALFDAQQTSISKAVRPRVLTHTYKPLCCIAYDCDHLIVQILE